MAAIFVGRLHVGGGERLAVMEFHALAQLHLHRVFVDWIERLGEFEDQFVRLFRPHRCTGQIAEYEALNDQLSEIGVRGRIPVAGQRLGAQKTHRTTFRGESRIVTGTPG